MAVQVKVFKCGSVAMGICMFHAVTNAITMSSFLSYWAAIAGGSSSGKLPRPDFRAASSLFPLPKDPLPESFLEVMERAWFREGKFVTCG